MTVDSIRCIENESRTMLKVDSLNPQELLDLHASVMDELLARGIVRSANNPRGDLAEYLFCRAFGWTQAGNSNPNLDAMVGMVPVTNQRAPVSSNNGSRQLSAIRDLDGRHFDVLAGVLFTKDYTIQRAALIPYDIVASRCAFVGRTNSHKFFLRDDVWTASGVEDVTATLRAVSLHD